MAKIKFNPTDYLHKRIVLDASVLIKSFFKEDGRDLVHELFDLHMGYQLTLMATPLINFELLNVLSNKIKKPDQVERAFEKFNELGIAIIEPKSNHISGAIEATCNNSQVSYYDASYHALAKDMDAVFLTADRRYYDLMKEKGNIALFE